MTGPAAFDASPVVDGLWLRVRDAILAERRLERFAFAPEGPETAAAPGRLAALAADPGLREGVVRDMTLRALAAAADDVNFRVLTALGPRPPATLGELADRLGLPALAVAERLGTLSQVGLARRNLERDAAEATGAGLGLVALVRTLCEGVEDRLRRDLPALLES